MNSNFNDRYEGNFQTHRSERYRHPEQDRYRFDDYGSSARGGYGNEGNAGTWGNQGNEMGGSRRVPGRGWNSDTYSTSRNYGNMGSYGGAQGFGSERGGYSSQHPDESRTGYNYYSGMGSSGQARQSRGSNYGESNYRSDYRRDVYSSDRDRYGSGSSGRYGRAYGGRHASDEDRYNAGSEYYRGSSRGSYNSPNYGGYEGNYMGSGYSRSSRGDYGSGGSGSHGLYGGSGYSSEPYGMSGYYSGGYGDRNQGWNDNLSGSNYFKSENRGRTFDRDRGDDRGRSYRERY